HRPRLIAKSDKKKRGIWFPFPLAAMGMRRKYLDFQTKTRISCLPLHRIFPKTDILFHKITMSLKKSLTTVFVFRVKLDKQV
ncbi:MAG: hypothetical protein AB2693_28430, partial [Candidatus Thiodiazotropha sp.]